MGKSGRNPGSKDHGAECGGLNPGSGNHRGGGLAGGAWNRSTGRGSIFAYISDRPAGGSGRKYRKLKTVLNLKKERNYYVCNRN